MYDAWVKKSDGEEVAVTTAGDRSFELSEDDVMVTCDAWEVAGYRVIKGRDTLTIDVYPPNSKDGDGQEPVAIYRKILPF